jgi:cell division protein FtsW
VLRRIGTQQLVGSAAALLGLGLVMVYSASAMRAEAEFGSSSVYLVRQLQGIAAGLGLALLAARLPLPLLRRLAPVLWLVSVALVLATLSPLGVAQNGARRWLALGPVVFQPLEIAKLGAVLALAAWLAHAESRMRDPRCSVLAPAAIAGVPAALLLCQPDFGGALLFVLVAAVLVYVAGARLVHLGAVALGVIPLVVAAALSESYRVTRLLSFADPWEDPLGRGYQLVQSLLAFGAGGIAGAGLGAGQQKLGYLPEAHTDFILSVVGEELGLLGVTAVLACFLLLGLAALGVASRAPDRFAQLLALGAGMLIWLQGLVNAGVALGALPTKGTTLPLFSYGRSSAIVSLVAIGLLLNVARPAKRGRFGWR